MINDTKKSIQLIRRILIGSFLHILWHIMGLASSTTLLQPLPNGWTVSVYSFIWCAHWGFQNFLILTFLCSFIKRLVRLKQLQRHRRSTFWKTPTFQLTRQKQFLGFSEIQSFTSAPSSIHHRKKLLEWNFEIFCQAALEVIFFSRWPIEYCNLNMKINSCWINQQLSCLHYCIRIISQKTEFY